VNDSILDPTSHHFQGITNYWSNFCFHHRGLSVMHSFGVISWI